MYSSYGYSSGVAEAAIGVVVVLLIMLIPLLVLGIIGICKVFKKAGRPVGFAFIPVYNYFVQFDFSGCRNLFWVYLPIVVVNMILGMFPIYGGFATFLSVSCSIGMVVVQIISSIKLAKAFGKGGGFAVGLILLYPIFIFILGKGSSQYIGPDGGQYVAPQAAQPTYSAQPAQPAQPAQQESDTWKCPVCGAYNLKASNFCFHCGQQKG